MPGHKVGFSKRESCTVLNRFFTKDGLRGILDGYISWSVDYIFNLIEEYNDTGLGRVQKHEQSSLRTL